MDKREVSTQDRLLLAQRDRYHRIGNPLLTDRERRFVTHDMGAVEIDGVTIVAFPIRHEMRKVPNLLQDAIASPHTRVVVPEYFYPEMSGWIHSSSFPILQKLVKWPQHYEQKVQFSRKLTESIETSEKTVATTDIANKPLYFLHREILRTSPFASLALILNSSYEFNADQSFIQLFFATQAMTASGTLSVIVPKVFDSYLFDHGKAIYDPKQIHQYERAVPHFEVARRLFAAKGIEQLVREYPSTHNNPSQIVLAYPTAHWIRIFDILLHPKPRIDHIMETVFRGFGPGLDVSVRQWEKKTKLTNIRKQEDSAQNDPIPKSTRYPTLTDWMMVSNRPINFV